MSSDWNRRRFVQVLAGATLAPSWLPHPPQPSALLQRAVPSTGELLPVVGLGTWQQFDVGASPEARRAVREVLRRFAAEGGRVVDSSPMYGRAEAVVGDLGAELGVLETLFMATKVWTRGAAAGVTQMEESFRKLRVRTMDLMQVHNLVDWRAHLETLRRWKAEGRIRYLGVSHYQVSAYPRLEELIRTQRLDFVQLNYSLATREAERRLLPLAADHGVGIIVNRPFEGGSLFRRMRGRPVPDWARAFGCESWGQFFLKYVLAAPEVTCAIPGTSNPEHVVDNLGAARNRLPTANERRRMIQVLDRA